MVVSAEKTDVMISTTRQNWRHLDITDPDIGNM